MKVVVQRSKESFVKVDNKIVGKINYGLVLLVGFTHKDNEDNIKNMVNKIINLRIFDDENKVMNKNIIDIKGNILSISQFTLYANTSKGNRPSYIEALNKDVAVILYNKFNDELRKYLNIETGIFHADMEVNIINNGPVTIILEN